MGRATVQRLHQKRVHRISIHALRGEGDDIQRPHSRFHIRHFNPRPPWGGRRYNEIAVEDWSGISIHALRGEGDAISAHTLIPLLIFQSTPSVRRATIALIHTHMTIHISIHALRGEGDIRRPCFLRCHTDFNPRPPWGGRPRLVKADNHMGRFQSTPSVGRATDGTIYSKTLTAFQSTPSVGRATKGTDYWTAADKAISIHALRGEGDNGGSQDRAEIIISIHALRGEGDRRLRCVRFRG